MAERTDLAARLARIKEQENTANQRLNPRTMRRRLRPHRMRGSVTEPIGLLVHRPLVLGGIIAIALTLYALSPANEERVELTGIAPQTPATEIIFGASEILHTGELDNHAAHIAQGTRYARNTVFEVPKDIHQFINPDGTLKQMPSK